MHLWLRRAIAVHSRFAAMHPTFPHHPLIPAKAGIQGRLAPVCVALGPDFRLGFEASDAGQGMQTPP